MTPQDQCATSTNGAEKKLYLVICKMTLQRNKQSKKNCKIIRKGKIKKGKKNIAATAAIDPGVLGSSKGVGRT